MEDKTAILKEKISDMYYKFYRFFRKVKNFPRGMRRYTSNIESYTKFLWKDNEWNGEYSFYYFLETKLNKLEKFYSNPDIVWQVDEGRLEILRQVKYAKEMLIILLDESLVFNEEELLFINKYIYEINVIQDLELFFEEEDSKRFIELIDTQEKTIKKIRGDLFTYLGEHIEEWWD